MYQLMVKKKPLTINRINNAFIEANQYAQAFGTKPAINARNV